uniref:Gamma-glutamylcyclotransferase family protein n=1 Tax=Ciona intestinalis TaxID=7719 RepID=F6XY19_CIOIN|nr:putative gamma-glutamylcyclotransferase CG2811 [Ciona intestinalis]|eukprot:XP_002124027.1 putative gamma-glutamylcyclotransferase CG2811 [Ciona intestinalis]
MHLVYVYGTLKTGFPNHYLISDPENGIANFLYEASTVEKFALVVGSPFHVPFLLQNTNHGKGNVITGELYEVDDEMLKTLDKLENHPTLYLRSKIQVKRNTESDVIECDAYLLTNYKLELLTLPMLTSYNITTSSSYISPQERSSSETLKSVKLPN